MSDQSKTLDQLLQPHPSAALEYWFFKFNQGDVALLVDWIAHRRTRRAYLRISIHSPIGREVLFENHAPILSEGAKDLTLNETAWLAGNARWQLSLEVSPHLIHPQIYPTEQLKLFDMSLVSAPDVLFSGWIEYRNQHYLIERARGMISHYWGRALPKEWWWISANQFEGDDVSLEGNLLLSSIWGTPLRVPLGYFYYRRGERSELLIAPPSQMAVTGTPEAFELNVQPAEGPQITIKATGRQYAPLGDGIINTLTGDLEIWLRGKQVAMASGTAALERREPEARASS